MSSDIAYKNITTKEISLQEGENRIGDVIVEYEGDRVVSVKKEEKELDSFIGFNNAQQFFLMGAPYFSLLFVTIFLGIILSHLKDPKLRSIGFCVFFFYGFTSVYYTLWTFLVLKDFSDWAYYSTLIVSSLFITLTLLSYFRYRKSMTEKLSSLVNYILYTRHETIRPLAEQAHNSNKEKTETIVSDSEEKLKETLSNIV